MIVPIEKQFNKIEEQRRLLLDEIARLSHEQQNFKPSPEAWSILQVVNHLLYAEANSVKYLQKKMQGVSSVPKGGVLSGVRSFALNVALRLPVKYKAPKFALPVQEEVYVFENIREQWNEVRDEFRKILDQIDADTDEKLIFKHPVAGRLNIYQTLSFLHEHIEHHFKQVERIRTNPEFPRP